LPPLPVPAQIAYAQSDMPICAERGLAPKSSDLCKKAGFATGSIDMRIFLQVCHHRPRHPRRSRPLQNLEDREVLAGEAYPNIFEMSNLDT